MRSHLFQILAVDDSDDDLYLLQRAFRKIGSFAPVLTVPDGEQAIAYFKGEAPFADRQQFPRPDLVVLDLKMPKMDGFEVLEWLRDHPQEHCRIVVFTSSLDDADRHRALDLGAHAFSVKPSNPAGYLAFAATLAASMNDESALTGCAQCSKHAG
jgi:CheY-like chemotaxis protein